MTALGTAVPWTPSEETAARFVPIGTYRPYLPGRYLGPVSVYVFDDSMPTRKAVSDYMYRMAVTIVKQLWPDHGQRFPQ